MCPGGGAAKVRRLSAINIWITQQEYLFSTFILRAVVLAQGSEKNRLRSIALDLRCTKVVARQGPRNLVASTLFSSLV